MNSMSTVVDSADSQVVVAGEFLDAIVEAVVLPRDPWARSAVVCSLVNEMCAAVGRLHEPDTPLAAATDVELASIGQLAKAAQDHHWRMSWLRPGVAGRDTR